jgi:NAD(P)-dependent dehydrogenase (short-subunit alcohol dehydrogenase family)
MLLKNKNAIIYGGGGAVGGAVASAFAREGARVFLTGRSQAPVDKVAGAIAAAGWSMRSTSKRSRSTWRRW